MNYLQVVLVVKTPSAHFCGPNATAKVATSKITCIETGLGSVAAVRALDGLLGGEGAAVEAQAALLARGLVNSSRDPDVPRAVGAGASKKTGAVEAEVVACVHGPALGLEPAAGAGRALVEILQDALACGCIPISTCCIIKGGRCFECLPMPERSTRNCWTLSFSP